MVQCMATIVRDSELDGRVDGILAALSGLSGGPWNAVIARAGSPGPLDVLGSITAEIAEGLDCDWNGLSHSELADAVAGSDRLRVMADALDARIVAAGDEAMLWAEHGNASMTAYLRSHSNHHPAAGSRRSKLATVLSQMPLVRGAFESGEISADHVRLLGTCLHSRFGGQFADFETDLTRYARDLSWNDFKILIARWQDAADESMPDDRDSKDAAARDFHIARGLNDRGIVSGTLTPIARVIIDTELQRLRQHLFKADWAAAVEKYGKGNVTKHKLGRTDKQRRHDALKLMAQRSANHNETDHNETDHSGAGDAGTYDSSNAKVGEDDTGTYDGTDGDIPDSDSTGGTDGDGIGPAGTQIHIHLSVGDAEAMLAYGAGVPFGPVPFDEAMCELSDGTPISYNTAMAYSIQAHIRRIIIGPKSEILDYGRNRRLFTPTQKSARAAIQRACVCGCGLPATLCEGDHLTEDRDNGQTNIRDLVLRCPKSHTLKTAKRTTTGHGCPCACKCIHRRT